ncbi:MAG: YdjY domain-containing protein [Synergistaceae bacterium]|jgi:hypothetical protein|nr:YdjY domain-containing protein [Synergistaceae bacterium]
MKKAFFIALAVLLFSGAAFSADTDIPLPVVVDKEGKSVTVPAEVNAKYFAAPTRHGVVYLRGSNGEKAVLRGLADEKKFHAALLEIGAKPGDNVTLKDMNAGPNDGVRVEGSKLNVFITWDGLGKEIPFDDVINATEERPSDYRFGGNLPAAEKAFTGCILCLDSCAVGIVSNASYPTGTTQNNVVEFFGDESVLPPDGTMVSVVFRLAE